MAISARTTFISGALPLTSTWVGQAGGTRCNCLRVVSESSTAFDHNQKQGKEEGRVLKQEVQDILISGVEKSRSLWWAPLFNVSADEQWSTLLANSDHNETEEEAGPPLPCPAPVSSARGSSTPLPDLISSSKKTGRIPRQVEFTAEKARALRRSMRASQTWHDGWYHSAIATRLAEPDV